jgi:hypothetical protein
MLNRMRRHLNRLHNNRELLALDPRLRADIGWTSAASQAPCPQILLLPLGPGDRTRCA